MQLANVSMGEGIIKRYAKDGTLDQESGLESRVGVQRYQIPRVKSQDVLQKPVNPVKSRAQWRAKDVHRQAIGKLAKSLLGPEMCVARSGGSYRVNQPLRVCTN